MIKVMRFRWRVCFEWSDKECMVESGRMLEVRGRHLSVAIHNENASAVVVFCHGFRGTKVGPSRFFVRTARRLMDEGIGSFRFDQYGSGDSEGDFMESSFDDWVVTTGEIVRRLRGAGKRIALLGQSMGGAAALVAAADLNHEVDAVVAWSPDPNVDSFIEHGPWVKEGGQRVQSAFWRGAHAADVAGRLADTVAPTLIFVPSADEFVCEDNQHALLDAARPSVTVERLPGWVHSAWTYDQATEVIEKSVKFLREARDGAEGWR